jgi:hypothetical protein
VVWLVLIWEFWVSVRASNQGNSFQDVGNSKETQFASEGSQRIRS